MPLRVPSFPVPGASKREAEEDKDACDIRSEDEAEEDVDGEADGREEGVGAAAADGGEPPEMMELVDQIEEAKGDAAALAQVLRSIGRRLRLSPSDRDMLCDFEGVAQLCACMAAPPVEWRGEAMLALCRVLPDICRTSTLNRGALRDGGAVEAVVELLRRSLAAGEEAVVAAACVGLDALCTASDGNKKAAAALRGEFNEEELVQTGADYRTPLFKAPSHAGALDLLLEALSSFPKSVSVQTQACGALRTLLCDDDSRQATCVPSAVENRERAVDEKHFPAHRAAVERALALGLELPEGRARLRLREQALLLLRELACRQDRIHELVFEARLLPHIEAALQEGDERAARASLAVIRAFAFSDELKEKLAVESDVALRCVAAVRRHVKSAPICEQGFGLFANLTMRKPHIASRLNGPDFRVFAVGQLVLAQYRGKPNVVKSVIQTLRNVATQDEQAALEVKDSDFFEEMRRLVVEHQDDASWRSPVEIAKQLLREFRADQGLQKAAQYNEFY